MYKHIKSLFSTLTTSAVTDVVTGSASDKLETAVTKYVEANGVNFSYREIGNGPGIPLVMLIHFTGTMDYWDPAVVNGLAKQRKVIVFNNRGIGNTSGQVVDNISQMSSDAITFIKALGLKKVDLLGFSLGGFWAQEMAASNPELINKVILAGTSAKGDGDSLLKILGEAFAKKDISDVRQHLFFSPSEKSQAASREFIKRVSVRTQDRDPESGKEIADAQAKAIITWGATQDNDKLLRSINQPVLIVQGSNDNMLPTESSIHMFKTIKNAQLILYPDSGHGSIFEYHESFVNAANFFLNQQ